MDIQFSQHLLKRLSFPHGVFLAPLSKISSQYVHALFSGRSILSHCSVCQYLLPVPYCFSYCSAIVLLYYCTNTIAVTLHKNVKIAQKESLNHRRTDDNSIINTTTQNNSYSENNKQSPLHRKMCLFVRGFKCSENFLVCYFHKSKRKISSS